MTLAEKPVAKKEPDEVSHVRLLFFRPYCQATFAEVPVAVGRFRKHLKFEDMVQLKWPVS